MEKCGTCVFYLSRRDECHRLPPVVMANPNGDVSDTITCWPEVEAGTYGCSQHVLDPRAWSKREEK